jgi:hypothetical protein
MKLNVADVSFYLSVVVLAWNNVQQAVHSLVSDHSYIILNIVFTVVATLSYALYENVKGTTPPPVPPAVS